MRRHPLIISAVLTALGLALGLASGGGAQTVDGLDLAKVRERARLSPEDAEAFGKVIARRGDAVKTQAAASAAAARANAARHARTAAVNARPGNAFDFDAMVAAAGREAGSADDAPRLVAFASLSMPAASLRQMIDDVGRAGGVVVFRGFPGNSVKQFTGALARVVPAGSSNAVGIDPRLFRAFAVTTVPTYVVTSTDFDLCDGFDCTTHVPPHDRMSGNVSLGHALDTFAQGSGPGAGIADLYRARLEGSAR
ncbi:type-F conjugative transfer system pilin assembly protein TrbC [Sphingomonas sp. Tas61C01]|uniref:type-F conjugative transfer system pilin assembly protein TrbC n=1 Tax=Sphingomonas sp. Tas61C01 TaxID=3458297 RepID=UPI00403EC29C